MLADFRVRQRDYLLEISRAITAQLDLAAVLRLVLKATVEMVSGQAGLVALRQDDGSFAVRASLGLPEPILELLSPLWTDLYEKGDLGWRTSDLEPRLALASAASGVALRQVVALPMSVGEETFGAIYVFRRWGGRFSANDRLMLASFADQAAIAVHNAQLYEQVSREKLRLDAIIEYSADGVMILDAAHRIQVFNRALAALTGWTAADALGRDHDKVIRWARIDSGTDLASAEAGGWPLTHRAAEPVKVSERSVAPEPGRSSSAQTLYVEGDLRRRDGSSISVGITYAPLLDREGRLVNIIADVHDITRFREAEELKSTFVSVISHELKTPVSLIKGYAGTLRREDARWDEETLRESLAVIEEESDRLNELIDNLLDASRLQASALPLKLHDVALDEVAQRIVHRFRPQTDRHQFSVDFPRNFPEVLGDEARLEQVLSNLLTNAIKYSPEGGTIQVSGRALPDRVVLTVSDEGMGIAPTKQTRVFDAFYRVDDAPTRRTQGTGLGLYLAKAVVEAHGGRIWVESEPGQGAAFSFSLPKRQ
jgi:signal transduction histidine kinase